MKISLEKSILGCLLGTAVGDTTGLIYEGLSPLRQQRLYPQILGPRFFFFRGMISDDTEHTCMLAQSLIRSAGDVALFKKDFSRRLRYWLLRLPAGIGLGTLRAIVKLWCGFSSGVYTAGNGPAMRSAILGVCYGSDILRLKVLVRASTELTHTDPKAYWGSLSVALAAFLASQEKMPSPEAFLEQLQEVLAEENAHDYILLMQQVVHSVTQQQPLAEFVKQLGLTNGVSGYMLHTIPIVIRVWLTFPNSYPEAMIQIIRLGGDTDTTAAILGAIIGARVGKEGIPEFWLKQLRDWPCTKKWIESLAEQLTQTVLTQESQHPQRLSAVILILRNLFFMMIVLGYGFRRLLPPYAGKYAKKTESEKFELWYLSQIEALHSGAEIAPPWIAFPNTDGWWGGWRQGNGEGWLHSIWIPFWKTLTLQQREVYLEKWKASAEWQEYLRIHWNYPVKSDVPS